MVSLKLGVSEGQSSRLQMLSALLPSLLHRLHSASYGGHIVPVPRCDIVPGGCALL